MQEQKQDENLAIKIGNFLTNKVTISLSCLLFFLLIIISFISYKAFDTNISYKYFSNKPYDF